MVTNNTVKGGCSGEGLLVCKAPYGGGKGCALLIDGGTWTTCRWGGVAYTLESHAANIQQLTAEHDRLREEADACQAECKRLRAMVVQIINPRG